MIDDEDGFTTISGFGWHRGIHMRARVDKEWQPKKSPTRLGLRVPSLILAGNALKVSAKVCGVTRNY